MNKNYNNIELKLSKISLDIATVDGILDRIQKLFPEDLKVYDRIAEARDAFFRLESQIRGVEVEVFCAAWIDPEGLENGGR
ncbi:MAG: hypothetical protein M3299_07915 [Thermoproteota archaeon]|nr:hypothetical protein [Thermoproteota archaeon]